MASDAEKLQIKNAAAEIIKAHSITEWKAEAHIAMQAKRIRDAILRECKAGNRGIPDDIAKEIAIAVAKQWAIEGEIHGFGCNSSQFRQWLESKDVALLKKQEQADAKLNRYLDL